MQVPTDIAAPPPSSTRGKLILAFLLASAIGVFLYFDLAQYLSLDTLKANRDRLKTFTEQHYGQAVAIFIGSYCLLVSASLPGAVFLTLAGGFLFGSVLGTLYVNIGATTGSILAFLAARYLFRDWVERKFGHRLRPIQEGIAKDGFGYLLTLRLIPLFPFFIVNALAGLTRIPLGTYALATAIGIIPGTFIYAYAAEQLGAINSLRDIASPRILLAFTLLGLLALVPGLYRKFRRNKGKGAQT